MYTKIQSPIQSSKKEGNKEISEAVKNMLKETSQ